MLYNRREERTQKGISMKNRNEIDARYKWDLTVIYPDVNAFDADMRKAKELIKQFPKHESKMLESGASLYAALTDDIAIGRIIDKLWSYASLSFSLDTSCNEYQALTARVRALATEAGSASWFLAPYLLRLDEKTLARFYEEEPRLESYRRIITKAMRRKPHMLSDESEELLSRLDELVSSGKKKMTLLVPYSEGSVVTDIYRLATVLECDYVDEGTLITAECDARAQGTFAKYEKQ